MVEFTVNFGGKIYVETLDTIFTKDGKQLVKEGNGIIRTGLDITNID